MEKQYETPETNVKLAALKLMRFKAMCEDPNSLSEWVLQLRDVNEILTVAGLPVIMPGKTNEKEVEVML